MRKKYFMAFEFYDSKINKHWSGIVDFDLEKTAMIDVAKEAVRNVLPHYNSDHVDIKIIAFNNIDTGVIKNDNEANKFAVSDIARLSKELKANKKTIETIRNGALSTDRGILLSDDALEALGLCIHGEGLTDYCQPCGRIHSE